jgi:hypothetical protein
VKGTKIDRTSPDYAAFLEIPGPVSLYCRKAPSLVRSIKTGHAFVKDGKLTKRGMCQLDGYPVHEKIHPSLEAYAFLVIRGKCRMADEFDNLPVNHVLTAAKRQKIKNYSDVLVIRQKATRGETIPVSSAADGLTWNWTPEISHKYTELCQILREDNAARRLLPVDKSRFDVFRFPQLSPEDKKLYFSSNSTTKRKGRTITPQPCGDLCSAKFPEPLEADDDPFSLVSDFDGKIYSI